MTLPQRLLMLNNWKITLMTLVLTLTLGNRLMAGETHIHFETGTWSEIQAKAAKEHKPIFVDAFTTWCGPCKWMSANVFTDSAVAEYYNTHFINAKIDMEKGEGIAIAKQYGVKAYPTLLYVDASGAQLHRTCGTADAKEFIANGTIARDPNKNLSHYKELFESGKQTGEMVMQYFDMLDKACTDDLTKAAEIYLTSQTQLATADNWKIIQHYVTDVNSKEFKYLMAHRGDFEKLSVKQEVDKKITSTYFDAIRKMVRLANGDEKIYNQFKADINKTAAEFAPALVSQLDVAWYKQQKQWDEYAAAVIYDQEKFPTDDHTKLNGFAWDFYEHVDDATLLDKALTWSKSSIAIQDKSYNEDTYAWLLFKTGQKTEAAKVEEKAMKMASEAGEDLTPYKEALERFKRQGQNAGKL